MIDEKFIYIGLVLSSIGTLSYLIDTIKGKVKPNRVTWALWALAPLIAFFAEIKKGVGLVSLMTFIVGFNPLLVFLASFVNKKAVWKINSFDLVCGGISVLGLVFWYITREGNVAIIFSILADGTASLPTIVKSYRAPESENPNVYIFSGINAAITLLAIKTWNIAHYGFPLYIFLVDIILAYLVLFRPGRKSKKIASH